MAAKKKYYLPPEEFIAEYAVSEEKGEPTDNLISMFRKIAVHCYGVFPNKRDQNACVNYAVCEAWRKWNKYDKSKENCNIFSLFTTMIFNDMMAHYKYINRGSKINISIDALFSNNND